MSRAFFSRLAAIGCGVLLAGAPARAQQPQPQAPLSMSVTPIESGFVIAPDFRLTLTPWMRLDVGAAYRFIGASDLLGDELHGRSGSIAVQFGGGR